MVHGLNQKEHSPMVIRNYFQQMHPHVTIRWLANVSSTVAHLHHFNNRTITWGKDTRRLRRLLLELDFTQVGYLFTLDTFIRILTMFT